MDPRHVHFLEMTYGCARMRWRNWLELQSQLSPTTTTTGIDEQLTTEQFYFLRIFAPIVIDGRYADLHPREGHVLVSQASLSAWRIGALHNPSFSNMQAAVFSTLNLDRRRINIHDLVEPTFSLQCSYGTNLSSIASTKNPLLLGIRF